MKRGFFCSLVAAVAMLCVAPTSRALNVYIVGDLSFTGSFATDNSNFLLATRFTSFNSVEVIDPSGDYAGTAGTPATFTAPIIFSPATAPGTLWQFTLSGTDYSFEATTLNLLFRTQNLIAIEGEGVARITGHLDTPGTWNLTANKAGTSFSFSSSAVAIPEPTGFVLTALGLGAFVALRRRSC